ncbi:GAF domain-containing protein [Halospeciosus flavus]|uniref:GAF domain-containing protein n=1 Tax=Halospeciosus flavus TaxID=3032283 RepID=A0ABD5Z3I4_9EURY|nr:GAF domain-containing protein [Halospeciosus flavus]
MESDKSHRILLVDDDSSFLQPLANRLEPLRVSFDVHTETDPTAALDRLEDGDDIDCVVGGNQLSNPPLPEFLHAVRNRESRLPFIGLVNGAETDPSELIEAGATNAFQKSTVQEHPERLATAVHDDAETYNDRQQLREGFEFLDTVLGSLDDVVYVTDTDGQPIYWNDAAHRITGYSSDEARQLDMLDFFPEDEHDVVLEALDTVLETGTVTFEVDFLTKQGRRVRYEFSGTTLHDQDGEVIGICGTGRNVAQRYSYEQTLHALLETTQDLFDATTREEIADVAVRATEYIVDNPLSAVYLYEDEQLVPVSTTDEAREVVGELPVYGVKEDTPAVRAFYTETAEFVEHAADIDDTHTRTSGWGVLYLPLGEYGVLALGFPRDDPITAMDRQLAEILVANTAAALDRHRGERTIKKREEMLETLHGTTRELIQTTDRDEIAEIIAADADDVLDLTAAAVFLWDDASGELRPVAQTEEVEALFGPLSTVHELGGSIWKTFVDGETTVINDATSEGEQTSFTGATGRDGKIARSQLFVPIGDFGIFISGSTRSDAFSETDIEFAELLTSNAATALERARREQTLEEKDQQLEARNEELRRVNRLNSIIRTINRGLIQANSRSEVQQLVCETLTDVDHYRFTWIGEETAVRDEYTPLAFAGEGQGILDQASGDRETTPIPERVQERGEPIVVNDIHRDRRVAAWRKAALNRGFRSLVCLPLRCDGHEYGFLEIYADQPQIFTDEEVTVLSELATQIANAIDAVERNEALLSGRETELEFEFPDIDDPLSRLARDADATIDVALRKQVVG